MFKGPNESHTNRPQGVFVGELRVRSGKVEVERQGMVLMKEMQLTRRPQDTPQWYMPVLTRPFKA